MVVLEYKKSAIIGHGGGGDESSSKPTEAPDSLQSTAKVRILDLVSEGEIEGFMMSTVEQSIKLDGTPLQNADNTFNFTGVTVDYRLGTQGQSYIPGFGAVENEISVNVQMHAGTPTVRTITNPNVNSARIIVSVPNLTVQTDKGNIEGTAVQISIYVQTNGGGYQQRITDVIQGKTRTKYQRQYAVKLTGIGPWDIKVTRDTPDSTSSLLGNDTYWDSYTEVIDVKLRYPNSALIGLQFDATQFSKIPTRSFLMKLLRVQVPTNYDPETRTYSGYWDGTFKVAWTNNPAWCFYDMVTNSRYGLGGYVDPALVDRWTLYDIGRYCDESIPDGFGGMEPRFTMNMYLQTREEAFKVIVNMASVFRAIVFWSAGQISASQDSPKEPEYQYTNANVIDGRFTYAGTGRLARHTVALVTWNDPSDSYKQKVEWVEADDETIDRYGIRETQIDAIGCTSRGQAHRFGKWALYSESMDTEVITFKTALEATNAYPGMIIQTLDNNRAGRKAGGRVIDSTSMTVTLDAEITFLSGNAYSLTCLMPDGTMETQPVTGLTTTTDVLQLVAPFSHQPTKYSIWTLTATDLVPAQWQILGVTRTDKTTFEITALQYNQSKFGFVEQDLVLVEPPTSIRTKNVPPVTNVTITQHSYTSALGGVRLNLTVAWQRPTTGQHYSVEYKKDNGNWIKLPVTADAAVEIEDATPGLYVARVTAFNALDIASIPAYSSPYALVGKSDVPPGLASLIVTQGIFEIDGTYTFAPNLGDIDRTEIWVSQTNDRGDAELLGWKAYPADTFVHSSLKPGDVFYYWGRTKNTSDLYSDWFPVDPFGGVKGSVSNDAKYVLDLVNKEIAGTLAGKTIGEMLIGIDFEGTGIQQNQIDIQNTLDSLHTMITYIGARLDAPNGDIATSLLRAEAGASVQVPTPISATPPLDPELGEAYYDSTLGNAAKYWNGTDWVLQSSAVDSTTAPTSPTIGELWHDTSNNKNVYRIWNGGVWVGASRLTVYSTVAPVLTGRLVGDTWKNPADNKFYVFNGTQWVDTQNVDVAAISSQIVALQTQVANNTSLIQQTIQSIGGVSGLYSVVIDINGHVSGFALSSEIQNSTDGGQSVRSAFVISVDDFAVGSPDHAGQYVFVVRDGRIIMDNALIGDADIGTLKLAGNAVTIPVVANIPGAMLLSTTFQQVASVTVNYPVAPASVIILFTGQILNGGGGNGLSQLQINRDGIPIYGIADGIVNNVYANKSVGMAVDSPGAGTHTYTALINYAGSVSGAQCQQRTISVIGAMR